MQLQICPLSESDLSEDNLPVFSSCPTCLPTHYRRTFVSISANTITTLFRGSDESVSLRLIPLPCFIIQRVPGPLWTHVLTQTLNSAFPDFWTQSGMCLSLRKWARQMKRQTWGGSRGWTFRGSHRSWEGREMGAMNGCTAAALKSQQVSVSVWTQPSPALKDAADLILPDEKWLNWDTGQQEWALF